MYRHSFLLISSVSIRYFERPDNVILKCQTSKRVTYKLINDKLISEENYIQQVIDNSCLIRPQCAKGEIKEVEEVYYLDNIVHRTGGPAIIHYERIEGKNRLYKECYCFNGGCHRVGDPAIIYYKLIEGKMRIYEEQYHNNGECHRTDGPAILLYKCISGKMRLYRKEYYVNDNHRQSNTF